MKFSKLFLSALAASLLFVSCSEDDNLPDRYIPLGAYDSGVLVLNQGGFGHGDASVSYISFGFTAFENDIFSLVNPDIILGDTAQDVGLYGTSAYIILNGSNKIEIVNRYTLQSTGTIDEGLSNPRYMAVYNGRGYVTNWGDAANPNDDYVAIIDLATNTVTGNISVAEGPERIIENEGKLYVAQTGGYGYGDKISVISTSNNAVTTVTVGDVPNSIQIKDGFLWVGCAGRPIYSGVETAGKLVKVNIATNTVATTFAYTEVTKHISNLVLEGSSAYYTVDSGIFKFDLTENSLPATPKFTTTAQGVYGVYSFAIKRGHIYVGDAGDYEHDGHVYIYSLGTEVEQKPLGTLENSFTVGVIPAGFYFNF